MTTRRLLGSEFFDRPALIVARELIGKYLVRRIGRKKIALQIVETEAYDGFNDLASHARHGQTKRNAPMFGGACTLYIYFTYGMHWMLNIVCGKTGYPAAVLIRGACVLKHDSHAKRTVYYKKPTGRLRYTMLEDRLEEKKMDGPAKLTKFLHIDKKLNNKVLGPKAGLWVEDRGAIISPRDILQTPRIGVDYAGKYAKKPWRFVYKPVLKLQAYGASGRTHKAWRRGVGRSADTRGIFARRKSL